MLTMARVLIPYSLHKDGTVSDRSLHKLNPTLQVTVPRYRVSFWYR